MWLVSEKLQIQYVRLKEPEDSGDKQSNLDHSSHSLFLITRKFEITLEYLWVIIIAILSKSQNSQL